MKGRTKNLQSILVKAFTVGCLILTPLIAANVQAAQIYQWKDASGMTHFTDRLSKVPFEYRKTSGRDVSDISATQVTSDSQKSFPVRARMGRDIWKAKCAECHYASGNEWKDDKKGLHRFIINEQTNFPLEPDQVLPRFRYAANGRTSSMPKIEISDEELLAVAKYLVSVLK